MTTIELMKKLLMCKSRRDMERLLNKHRVPVNKSKYC